MKILRDINLAQFTTLKIGGSARFFAEAKSKRDISEALHFAETSSLKVFILGGGSNILVSDQGFNGLVIKISLLGINEENSTFTVGAGEDWDNFVNFTVEKNFAGIECLSGIPGLVGGTPVQNVGAYGQEVSETITEVEVFDRKDSTIKILSASDCVFSYRKSIFNTTEKNRFIVLSVKFNLKKDGKPKITYADLKNFFGDGEPNLAETRQAILQIRQEKSMVIDENDVNSTSAGSFFKNPIVSAKDFEKIQAKARQKKLIKEDEKLPSYNAGEEFFKLPAAWLIEKSGFHKGFRLGKVGISQKHSLAVVNFENGNAEDVIELKNLIQSTVNQTFDVQLLPEPVFIGFEE